MDPVAESHWLYQWQGMEVPAEVSADPSLRQLKEDRLRMVLFFQNQSPEIQNFFRQQAVRIGTALMESKGEIHFFFPERICWPGDRKGEDRRIEVPEDFREQRVAGFLNRIPVKDVRSAFRRRLAQLENSGYSVVRASAGLLRYAVARHIVHDLVPDETIADLPPEAAGIDPAFLPSHHPEEPEPGSASNDPRETDLIKRAEGEINRLRRVMRMLNQVISLAPYMYTDEEYQLQRDSIQSRSTSIGHAVAQHHLRSIVRTIRHRAQLNDLNRGLWLSMPYFDDYALEMKDYQFEVIPPGRTMFVPAFVVLAAVREQERVEQQNSLSPSTRMHLLAGLKSLEQAFDGRPQ